jgi:5,10-methylenetetrahydrofolate reductase
VVTLTPLPSAVTAQWLKDTMKDSHIPPAIIKRLESAADPEQEGILICAEVMREVAEIPGVAAINLMTTGNSESILAAIEASGLRTDHDAET